MQPTRLAVLFHRFGPYHHARLRAAARLGDAVGIELSRVDTTYQWETVADSDGFSKVTLFDDRDIATVEATVIAGRLDRVLDDLAPEVIAVPGWGDAASLLALKWGCSRQVPVIAMSETTQADIGRNPLREAAKARIVGLFAGAIVGGRLHRDYLQRLGMRGERIELGYDCVDNDHFAAGAARARADATRLRAELRLPERYFLASSRFIERKNIAGLVRAYARYRAATRQGAWGLVVLGDGPLRASLQALAKDEGVEDSLSLPGFVQYGGLPAYYGLASAFIHPAFAEPWGLVVNEAMAASLPVLVSRQTGCAHELVDEGTNGFCFEAGETDALGRLMIELAARSDLPALGAASAALIAGWSCARFADNLWRLAARVCADRERPRPGLIDRSLLAMAISR